MEERQPEKRNDKTNDRPDAGRPDAGRPDAGRSDGGRPEGGRRSNRNRHRNRGNRSGGQREDRDGSTKPEEIMAYVEEADADDTPDTPAPATGANNEQPRPERPGNRAPNDRQRDNGGRQDRDRPEANRQSNRSDESRSGRPDAGRPDGGRAEGNGQPQPGGRDRNRERDRGRDRGERDRDRESERTQRDEYLPVQEWVREDSAPRPGESRLGEMRISDLAGRGADSAPDDRLVVGITLGDYNGIGPEVILKALQYNQLQRVCTPVIYGSMRVLNRYRNLLNLKDWNLNGIQHIGQASHKMTNVITCWNDTSRPATALAPQPATVVATEPVAAEAETAKPVAADLPESTQTESRSETGEEPQPVTQPETTMQTTPVVHEIQPGKVTPEAGQAALACLQRAVEDLKAGKLDALITGPINKYNIQSETFTFPGHTEYLAQAFGVPDDLMFMVGETLRVGVVTGHVPLGRVRQNVTRNAIHQKLKMMMESLRVDFGIQKPRIAVLGLNPHAGENGLLGNEEQETIIPVIEDWRKKGELVYGPFPADGFFGTRGYRRYDAVLAMYHDQGLIPFKAIAFDEGVNFTAGLPIVRTSPDHGTAYDIAGKNLADETSMTQAIYLACDVARRRKEHNETEANALKK